MKAMCEKVRSVIKSASGKLTGRKRRAYRSEVTMKFFGGSVRRAEKEMGWGRETVRKGIREAETGSSCHDNFQSRGRKRTEAKLPHITAKAVRKLLIEKKDMKVRNFPRKIR